MDKATKPGKAGGVKLETSIVLQGGSSVLLGPSPKSPDGGLQDGMGSHGRALPARARTPALHGSGAAASGAGVTG